MVEITFPAIVIDLLSVSHDWDRTIVVICLFSFLIVVLDFAIRRVRDLLSAHAERMDNYITLSLNQKSLSVDYQDTISAKSLDKASKGRNAISEFLEIDYILFVQVLGSFFSLAMLSYLILKLDIVALVTILSAALGHYFLEKKRVNAMHQYDVQKSKLQRKQQYMEELLFDLRYGKDIRVYDCSAFLKKKFLSLSDKFVNINQEQRKKSTKIDAINQLIQHLQIIILYIFAVIKYALNGITLGSFTIYLNAANEISSSVRQLLDSIAEISRVNVYFEDYDNYMNLPQTIVTEIPSPDANSPIPIKKLKLEFKKVSFRYPDSEKYVLRDICLTIREGETLSIVGDNGAGKTTLVYLILRLFDPTSGIITLNGIDIRDYPYTEYRKLVAPVFQDYELFSYSLQENVVFDRPVDQEKLQKCYQAADLSEKINMLSNGDQTILTKDLYEEGEDLSGGEKQKLSIARAYYHSGEILILDEPTAALDPISEYKIYQNIAKYRKNQTTIFISHRLTSTLFSDTILVMDNGCLVQTGTHEQLMGEQGLYADMFEKQAHYYRT